MRTFGVRGTWRLTLMLLVWAGLGIGGLSACVPTASVTPTSMPTSTPLPTATQTSTPTGEPTATSAAPSLTVVVPNGGEVWKEGQTYRIRWRASAIDEVNIEAATGGKDLGHIASEVEADAQMYAWTIPEGYVSGFGAEGSDAMRVRIYATQNPEVADMNDDPFTIEAP